MFEFFFGTNHPWFSEYLGHGGYWYYAMVLMIAVMGALVRLHEWRIERADRRHGRRPARPGSWYTRKAA